MRSDRSLPPSPACPASRARSRISTTPDPAFLGRAGEQFFVVGLDGRRASSDATVVRLRAAVADAMMPLRATYPRAAAMLTGEDALNHDLRLASAHDVAAAERRALPLTLVLLFLAFGAVAAAAIPLGIGALAIGLALGVAALAARIWPLSIALQNVVSMLGLGLGVDYTLLLVTPLSRSARRGTRSGNGRDRGDAPRRPQRARLGGHGRGGIRRVAGRAARRPSLDRRGWTLVVTTSALLATTLVPGLLACARRARRARARASRPGARSVPRPGAAGRRSSRGDPLRTLLVAVLPLLFLAAAGPPTRAASAARRLAAATGRSGTRRASAARDGERRRRADAARRDRVARSRARARRARLGRDGAHRAGARA